MSSVASPSSGREKDSNCAADRSMVSNRSSWLKCDQSSIGTSWVDMKISKGQLVGKVILSCLNLSLCCPACIAPTIKCAMNHGHRHTGHWQYSPRGSSQHFPYRTMNVHPYWSITHQLVLWPPIFSLYPSWLNPAGGIVHASSFYVTHSHGKWPIYRWFTY